MAFKAGRTAAGIATLRVMERYVPPELRLVDDHLAKSLFGPFLGTLLSLLAWRSPP